MRYLGPVGPAGRQEVLGGARALLHLIDFDEPFGFSVVEAMACGTPVIAYRRGSMPELVVPGENGVLVDTIEEAVEGERGRPGSDGRAPVRGVTVRRGPDGRRVPVRLPGRARTMTHANQVAAVRDRVVVSSVSRASTDAVAKVEVRSEAP